MNAKRIGLIGFDGVVAIDIAGPAEAFTTARIAEGERDAARFPSRDARVEANVVAGAGHPGLDAHGN